MKTTFGGIAAFALVMTISGGAMAQSNGPAAASLPRHARSAEPISQADFVQRRVERLRAADGNGDGQVTAEEMSAYSQVRRTERMNASFARLDTNKDGVLSHAEFSASQATGSDGRRMGPGRANRGHHSGANALPRPEGVRGQGRGGDSRFPIVIADVQGKAVAAFARMDANGDGVLTGDERRAAMRVSRPEMREKHQQRRPRPTAASPSAPALQ